MQVGRTSSICERWDGPYSINPSHCGLFAHSSRPSIKSWTMSPLARLLLKKLITPVRMVAALWMPLTD
jgi:hypothetical protein